MLVAVHVDHDDRLPRQRLQRPGRLVSGLFQLQRAVESQQDLPELKTLFAL